MMVQVDFDSMGGGDVGGKLIRPVDDGSGHPLFTWDYDAVCIVVFSTASLGGVNIYSLDASSPKRWWANSSYVWQLNSSPNVTNVTSKSIDIKEFSSASNWNLCAIPMEEYPDGYFT